MFNNTPLLGWDIDPTGANCMLAPLQDEGTRRDETHPSLLLLFLTIQARSLKLLP